MSVRSKAQKLTGAKKVPSLEELKQKYMSTSHTPAKLLLLKLIKKRDPKFQG